MRYTEIILEGRDAPLYHAAGLSTAVRIITSNRLQGFDAPISLTRNRRFAQFWNESHGGGVIFVLDQTRLSQTIPIKPGAIGGHPRRHEAEELVDLSRPITPLDRYLIAIEITSEDLDKIRDKPGYDSLSNHPLLKVVPPLTSKVSWLP